ncbi:hypothetical protein MD484_g6559, partial [Candolleomyces efflorescens]
MLTIMNPDYGTYVVGVPSSTEVPLTSSSSPQAWYLAQSPEGYAMSVTPSKAQITASWY